MKRSAKSDLPDPGAPRRRMPPFAKATQVPCTSRGSVASCANRLAFNVLRFRQPHDETCARIALARSTRTHARHGRAVLGPDTAAMRLHDLLGYIESVSYTHL